MELCIVRVFVFGFLAASFPVNLASGPSVYPSDQPRSTEDQPLSYFFYQQSEYPRDCMEVLGQCSSTSHSGVYVIKPDGYSEAFDVYCDSDGYTIIARRMDGPISFHRSWAEYESGFGFLSQEFWLGNRKLSHLTNQKKYQLRIDVTLNDGATFYATYGIFRIADGYSDYELISASQLNGTTVTCPNHMVFGTCSCQRSCADPDDCTTSRCHVTGSCVCPSGFLMENGYCIPQEKCGCFMAEIKRGTVLQEGGIYITPNCSPKFSCTSNELIVADDFQCSPQATCGQGASGWNCSCNSGYEGDGARCSPTATDCHDVFDNNQTTSGLHYIYPEWSEHPIEVYCNMEDGGGWTVFQRQDGSENFYRNWTDYKNGFGAPGGGMWLGNDLLHNLTRQKNHELRIDVTDRNGNKYYAGYSSFRINGETDKYRLSSVGSFSGNSGYDSLIWHLNRQFSTHDQDNDDWSSINCAEYSHGAWWYGLQYTNIDCNCGENCCDRFTYGGSCHTCGDTNLNSNYHTTTQGRNVFWDHHSGYDCSMQYTEMRIRPVQR